MALMPLGAHLQSDGHCRSPHFDLSENPTFRIVVIANGRAKSVPYTNPL
jgi:hypothetical protein